MYMAKRNNACYTPVSWRIMRSSRVLEEKMKQKYVCRRQKKKKKKKKKTKKQKNQKTKNKNSIRRKIYEGK